MFYVEHEVDAGTLARDDAENARRLIVRHARNSDDELELLDALGLGT